MNEKRQVRNKLLRIVVGKKSLDRPHPLTPERNLYAGTLFVPTFTSTCFLACLSIVVLPELTAIRKARWILRCGKWKKKLLFLSAAFPEAVLSSAVLVSALSRLSSA